MAGETGSIRERQAAIEGRLSALEKGVGDVVEELKVVSRLLRGNGDHGVMSRVELGEERLKALQGQWKWLAGLLTALVLAMLKSLLVG